MSDMPITRRNLAIRTGALALTGLLPSLAKAEEALPVVYYAREATPEAFLAIFDKLREDLGAVGRKGLVGLKLHGDEVDKNRALWKALQAHVPGSRYIECNWASGYTSGRGTTEGNYDAIVSRGIAREDLDILDRDGSYRDVQTKEGRWLKSVAVPEALFAEYGLVAVTVNFNVPTFSGYSAAVKNIGIGLAGGPGKAAVHGPGFPKDAGFHRRLAEAADAIERALAGKLVFLNVLANLDVEPLEGAAVKEGTIGILGSLDMAAVDNASLDLLYGIPMEKRSAYPESVKLERGFLQLGGASCSSKTSRRSDTRAAIDSWSSRPRSNEIPLRLSDAGLRAGVFVRS